MKLSESTLFPGKTTIKTVLFQIDMLAITRNAYNRNSNRLLYRQHRTKNSKIVKESRKREVGVEFKEGRGGRGGRKESGAEKLH